MCKLEIIPCGAQNRGYSCGASVLQIVTRYFKGYHISHEKAIELTRCKPDGSNTKDIKRALKKIGLNGKLIRRHEITIKKRINEGNLVIINDNFTYSPDDHWILISGYTENFFYIFDPNTNEIRRRAKHKVFGWSVPGAAIAVA